MTKTEQKIIDRVRDANDAGRLEHSPVAKTAGVKRSWRQGGGLEGRQPKKLETAALARLLQAGALVRVPLGGGYAIPGHEVLAESAASVNLMRLARIVDQAQQTLDQATDRFLVAQAFVRENSR